VARGFREALNTAGVVVVSPLPPYQGFEREQQQETTLPQPEDNVAAFLGCAAEHSEEVGEQRERVEKQEQGVREQEKGATATAGRVHRYIFLR
jgi:hypothetical protein